MFFSLAGKYGFSLFVCVRTVYNGSVNAGDLTPLKSAG
jgi:hypothetical protein